jgi:hypothetical protein
MAELFPRRPGPPAAIDPIRKLFPPHLLVHVGAGNGVGPLAQWRQWGLERVLVVDADPHRLAWADVPGKRWGKCSAVLAASDGPVEWYEASNADESGLLPAMELMGLWPSLILTQQQRQSAITLDTLLQERGEEYHNGCWLLIECLPVLPVLQGSMKFLEGTNVVWARVISDGIAAPHGATLLTIQQQLIPQNFVLVDVSTSSHPSIGYALFVKNQVPALSECIAALRIELQALQGKIGAAAENQQELDALGKANAALGQERAANAVKLDELQQMVIGLTQARDQQAKLVNECQLQIEQLIVARDDQAKLVVAGRAEIEHLTKACDTQVQAAAESQRRAEVLSNANSILEQEKAINAAKLGELQQQSVALTQTRDQQAKLAKDRQVLVEQLTAARDEQAKSAAAGKVELEQLAKARDEQAKTASGLKRLLEALDKAAAEKKASLTSDLEQLRKEKSLAEVDIAQSELRQSELQKELENRSVDLAKTKAELNKASAALKERDAKLATLEGELAERDQRQQMLNEEMVRAEAQIDLIKDVLLRESGV